MEYWIETWLFQNISAAVLGPSDTLGKKKRVGYEIYSVDSMQQ